MIPGSYVWLSAWQVLIACRGRSVRAGRCSLAVRLGAEGHSHRWFLRMPDQGGPAAKISPDIANCACPRLPVTERATEM
jgi:hypothetical protein